MSLKTKFKMTSIAAATAMAMGVAAIPATASADVEYNAAVASMYLFRGTDASNGPTVNGGVDYSHDSGFYAGAWVSSGVNGGTITAKSDNGNGYELDLYLGYSGEVSGFGYDVSFWNIDYPQTSTEAGNELALGLSYADFSLGFVKNTKSGSKYQYITAGYSIDKVGLTYGMVDDGASDYSHIDVSYAATDSVTFTLSKLSDSGAGKAEEMLAVVSYSLPIK